MFGKKIQLAGLFALSAALPIILTVPRTAVGADVGTRPAIVMRNFTHLACAQDTGSFICPGVLDSNFPASTLNRLYAHVHSYAANDAVAVQVVWYKTSYTGTVYIDAVTTTVSPNANKTITVTANNVKTSPHVYDNSGLMIRTPPYSGLVALNGYTYVHDAL